MSNKNAIQAFLKHLEESFLNDTFVKLTLGSYSGGEAELKNIYIKKIILKSKPCLSFVLRYKTKDITQNFELNNALLEIEKQIKEGFSINTLFCLEADFVLENKKNTVLKQLKPTFTELEKARQSHDKIKKRLIDVKDKLYLTDLKITDNKGNVFQKSQDKYKQINNFVELLQPSLLKIASQNRLQVVDMGSGKGYLTFALYDYLQNNLKINAQVVGVEFRKDMVQLCNQIAQKNSFDGLSFREGTIADFEQPNIDLLIALHACDTATDDAIFKGIQSDAQMIVVSPCCHKQIRREIEKNKVTNDLDFITQYGIYQERQVEMITDSMRALLLNHCGYTTKIVEFVSGEHTPKNILLIATKTKMAKSNPAILEKINQIKTYFGIDFHHLERLLKHKSVI
ncbi:MAG: SAM-dependent methyltransferase [Pseudarcicella sp.]|nr:SAM-dependent methyltransferase [Pseudarcicella sp.]MBP6410628.1 SAM-dependent methyltransferase [Pseudarcicella sp.]